MANNLSSLACLPKVRKFLIASTSCHSQGYLDLVSYIPNLITVDGVFLNGDYSENAFQRRLWNHPELSKGTALILVRGGGDISHRSFIPFLSQQTEQTLWKAQKQGAIVLTAIGHSTDHFDVERAANFSAATPSALGDELLDLFLQHSMLTPAVDIGERSTNVVTL